MFAELRRITLPRRWMNKGKREGRAEIETPALLHALISCLRLGNRIPVGLVHLLFFVGGGQDEVAICAVGVHRRQAEGEGAVEIARLPEQDLRSVCGP